MLPLLPQPSPSATGALPPILRAPSASALSSGATPKLARSTSITSVTAPISAMENPDQPTTLAGGAAQGIPFPLKNTKKGKSGVVQDYGIEADISVLNKVLLCQKNRSPLNPQDYYPLLPIMRCRRNRMTLVLDLDETLVHASSKPRLGVKYDTVIPIKDEKGSPAGLVHVAYRPHLHQFLRTVARAFKIVVFTASLSSYASPLLDQLDPTNEIISYRLYREHCVEVNGAKVKDLSLLGRPLDRVAIIDNSPVAYLFQPRNAIPIRSWFEDPHDTDLLVLLQLLMRLSQETTTYPVLDMYNAHLISLSLTPSP
jgi:Dullard-like phosphatase family protein